MASAITRYIEKLGTKLWQRIFISVGSLVVIIFTITIIFVGVYSAILVRKNALENARSVSEKISSQVEAELEVTLDTVRAIAIIFEGYENLPPV